MHGPFSSELEEVTQKFLNLGSRFAPHEEEYLKKKMYQTKLEVYNVDRVKYRQLLRSKYSFSHQDIHHQAQIWSYIFKNTTLLGVGHLAINFFKKLNQKRSINLVAFWPELKSWVGLVDNWSHGDMLASLYSRMLEKNPQTVLPTIKKWAESPSPWARRMAVVSLIYYYNGRVKVLPFEEMAPLILEQLSQEHYYLQKGVGWALRELGLAYPKKTWALLNEHIHEISPTAYATAVEKLSLSKRKQLADIRRHFRKAQAS